jgi:hypothetical protein
MLTTDQITPSDVRDYLVSPGDADWDAVRQTFNLLHDQRPVDRSDPVRHTEDRGGPSVQRLPQAQHPLAPAARGGAVGLRRGHHRPVGAAPDGASSRRPSKYNCSPRA